VNLPDTNQNKTKQTKTNKNKTGSGQRGENESINYISSPVNSPSSEFKRGEPPHITSYSLYVMSIAIRPYYIKHCIVPKMSI